MEIPFQRGDLRKPNNTENTLIAQMIVKESETPTTTIYTIIECSIVLNSSGAFLTTLTHQHKAPNISFQEM